MKAWGWFEVLAIAAICIAGVLLNSGFVILVGVFLVVAA